MINIIGAGPIGGHAAHLLAREGFKVNLFEEHKEIGKPVQCAGLFTASLGSIIKPEKEFMVNTIEYQEVVAPDGSKARFRSKEYVFDRTAFDRYFADKAVDAGAKLYLGHKFTGYEGKLVFKTDEGIKKVEKGITVGADGPQSNVAKAFGMFGSRKFYFGIQARVKGNFDAKTITTYFGNNIAPGLFAWVIPENESYARLGLASMKNAKTYFDSFIKKFNIKVKDMQAGIIPQYNPKICTQKGNVYLIGDAATQVKATTLGGVIPALKAGYSLRDAILYDKSYPKLWKKSVGRNLWLHIIARKAADKLSDKEWNEVIHLVSKPNTAKVIEAYDRERPFQLLKVLVAEPRLLKYARYMVPLFGGK